MRAIGVKIAQGDLGVLGADKLVNDHGARIGHQQGVPVSGCLDDDVRTNGRASTQLVIDEGTGTAHRKGAWQP